MFHKIITHLLPLMPKNFVWLFSKRYIAGKTIEDAIEVSKKLNQQHIKITIDLLGEFITNIKQAEDNKNTYLNIIDAVEKHDIDGNYSLKPTMFGLLIDFNTCYKHIREIVSKAAYYNNFIRIDMEDSKCVDLELKLFRNLKSEFPDNVGLVFQAYLKRTFNDIKNLQDLNTQNSPCNFRLCKGIYIEPAKIAYKKHKDINKNFIFCLELMLKNNIYPGIATHDKSLVEASYQLIEKYKIAKHKYEFQMLYGVTPELRKSIVEKGHNMRVYVPYGENWFAYSTRRLKENPKIAWLIIKALFSKK